MKNLLILYLMATLSAFTLPAAAGTYRNDSNRVIQVKNSDGQLVAVYPGKTIATIYVPGDPSMTETDAAPYYNPVAARHAVTSTGPGDDQTVVLNPASADYIFIWKVTATATVFYGSSANTPAAAILRAGDYYQHDVKGRAGRLVIQFAEAGSCEVLESKEPIK